MLLYYDPSDIGLKKTTIKKTQEKVAKLKENTFVRGE